MNTHSVLSHGSPGSFVRRVQDDPGIAVQLLHAARLALETMEMQAKRESGEFFMPADAFRSQWDHAVHRLRMALKECSSTFMETCPNCGGTEHVDPLPGTVGRRCVKCCDVR